MSGTWPLYSTHAARALDARATQVLGGDPYVLMQRAGLAAWQHLLLHWPEAQRIAVARVLLITTDLSVSAVAERVGISDYNYFTKVFKSIQGSTPSRYRQNRK